MLNNCLVRVESKSVLSTYFGVLNTDLHCGLSGVKSGGQVRVEHMFLRAQHGLVHGVKRPC